MIIMGIVIIFSAGVNWLILIVLFLIMSLLATKYAKPYKIVLGNMKVEERQKCYFKWFDCFSYGSLWRLPICLRWRFLGSIATATADTFA